jgi:hypothetical protein
MPGSKRLSLPDGGADPETSRRQTSSPEMHEVSDLEALGFEGVRRTELSQA